MTQYLLSTYLVEGEVPGAPGGPEEIQGFLERVMAVEESMVSEGVFLFGGGLSSPATAAVIDAGSLMVTDGPFPEAKEQIAGFYIIEAGDEDTAQKWATRVAVATGHPIEVRSFAATGLLKDNLPGG